MALQQPRPILVVDDDDETRAAEHAVLNEGGFRVVEGRDGAEAMWFMQHDPPAVIVLDVQMPGVRGPAFAQELRMGLKDVPLLILTAARRPRHQAYPCKDQA